LFVYIAQRRFGLRSGYEEKLERGQRKFFES
jgi:hypothetical protein